MVEARIALSNEEVGPVLAFVQEQQERAIEEMCAPVVTPTTEAANIVFRLLGVLQQQLEDHLLEVARLEKQAKVRNRERRRRR
jgi:hypothetical protein